MEIYIVFVRALLELNACVVRDGVEDGISQALANKGMQLTYHLRSHNKPRSFSLVPASARTEQNEWRKK